MNYINRAREIIDLEIKGLQNVKTLLNKSFDDAVATILVTLKAGGKIVVTGVGKNLHIAQKISATLASTGSTSVVLNPSQAIHGDLGILSEKDILLALSYSGESEELLAITPAIKRSHIKIITFTGIQESTLAKSSDIVINVAVDREACPFNMAPTTSTTATLAVGDALAIVLLEAQGFKKEDYAKLHPGGSIGRTLLLKVEDIMRGTNRMAIIKKDAKVKDALIAMTKAKTGSSAIINNDGIIIGIFTDGDLRRHLANPENILETPIESAMTPAPVTVTNDQLAVNVLKLFEDHNFDDLIVVDKNNHPIGIIDIQDLPKLKIL